MTCVGSSAGAAASAAAIALVLFWCWNFGSHSEFFLLVLSSNLEKNMSHMTGAGSSAGGAAASAAAIALVLPRSR